MYRAFADRQEGGLADTADAFGLRRTREQTLVVHQDTHLGSFGAIALILATGNGVGACSDILEIGFLCCVVALIRPDRL
ncbi:MAG: hypothetical protein GF398_16130 [Chitinivibrionales bacterium]|nr:hypothetical protein [Chitinivibrionales bacterium]